MYFYYKKHRSESEYFRINPYANIILEKVLNIFTIKVKSRTACLAIVGILIGGSGSTKRIPARIFLNVIDRILKVKKCKFFLATGKDIEEQSILNVILDSKFKNDCYRLDDLTIKETLPIIKCCNLAICNDSSFSHLSSAIGIKTITLMADTPLIYGNYNSKMFPIIPDGLNTVDHNSLGKEKINPEKIFNKVIEIIN